MLSVLSHPFFLLLAGGVLTGIIIPKISRKWQNYQKELDLKTELVTEMSESVMTIVMTFEFFLLQDEEGLNTINKEELRNKLKEWRIRSCVIGSKLHAYFPSHSLHKDWIDFSNDVVEACKNTVEKNWQPKKDSLLGTKAKLINLALELKIEVLG